MTVSYMRLDDSYSDESNETALQQLVAQLLWIIAYARTPDP
jgi:hypothetical protein